jgi:outer membrane lipoprotein SlyB
MEAVRSTFLARGRIAASAALMAIAASGCVTSLDVPEVRDPAQANVTVRYGAVRSEARMFADYSVIDARILADQGGAAQRSETRP